MTAAAGIIAGAILWVIVSVIISIIVSIASGIMIPVKAGGISAALHFVKVAPYLFIALAQQFLQLLF